MIKKSNENNSSIFKFIGMMGICCIIPIILAFILPLIGASFGTSSLAALVNSLICPIMMILMMVFMFKGDKSKGCCTHNKKQDKEV